MNRFSLRTTGLIVVDAQKGFSELCPKELPVPGALEIVPKINALLDIRWRRIDATQDWHPPDHRSFHGRQDSLYPPHCVMNTPGAEFLPMLRTERFHAVWRKGFLPDFEAYAVTAQHPEFVEMLRSAGIDTAVICGIAANICCFDTAKDLRQADFRVALIEDASAGIDVPAANLYQHLARARGQQLGIEYLQAAQLLEALSP